MKFTLSWLKDHLDTEASPDEIAHALTMLGLEVEGVENKAAALKPFTVAYVKEAKQHPDADRLRVCTVDTGREEVQVICGAPNARTGMKGVFAPVGSYVPGIDLKLKAGKIRGVDSNGMLVSEREMGLSDEHEGIIDLPEDAPVGEPFAKVMGLDDPVFDIAITPNRADCLGVRGVARDLAAAGFGTLKPLDIAKPVEGSFDSPMAWRRDLPAGLEDACPYVAGRYFRGVTNGPSPEWMQRRLRAIGLRPISALVDITNYVTFDLGRPLHVFDADKVAGDLTMRMAGEGETIAALDERAYTLDPEMVVIADANAAHGIGGVMGGETSGVSEETTNVFLEVALFDPVRIAKTGRKLGVISDARYRFERGLDPQSADWGQQVATRLILDLCGGEASRPVDAGTIPDTSRTIDLRPGRIAQLGGIEIDEVEARAILDRLGFATQSVDGVIRAQVPSWRADVEGEADLIEEVLRVHGYDDIPVEPLPQLSPIPQPAVSPQQRRAELARTTLAWRGLDEAVTFSFMSSRQAEIFGGVPQELHLANPISSELDVMRPVALANLVEAAGRNADRGFPDVALFEIGPQYRTSEPDGQDDVAAGVRAGRPNPRHWAIAGRPLDAFDAKADAIAALTAVGAPADNLQTSADAPGWYHPGRSGVLHLGPKVLANFGELHPKVLEAYDLRGPAVAFEVFLNAVPAPKTKGGKLKPALMLSPFQPVERDFAFVVDEDVPAEKLLRAAKGAEKQLVTEVKLFDVYTGDKVGAGKKSLAIAVTLQPTEKTLTDAEIEAVGKKIVQKVEKDTGGELRG
ncbi:phenylalanine--tRNA ligase subunit beta [Ferruginivarius sediminum]|uniref:Phenylalanine--tRNA ligase beta subunit n=1 Tax=Ferruginivarius sediminum TaxID=2661937 RepID=A0A369TAU8_9PROT|nr:phenylalanine--tRNA ligase subunit beta [Ferruginivarius sediminum]RDD61505.1 phenylalanine--tRNA ligase subunit beta [Ferruginivarius sediminum]